jgi:hypothetical protein
VGDAVNFEESHIQQAIVAGVRWLPGGEWLFHIPNGFKILAKTKKQRDIIGARWKREGVLPGVCDLCLPIVRGGYHGLYMEVKEGKKPVTEEQKAFIAHVQAEGYKVIVVRSAQQGIDAVIEYLKGGR